jgi:hypothetical protein
MRKPRPLQPIGGFEQQGGGRDLLAVGVGAIGFGFAKLLIQGQFRKI